MIVQCESCQTRFHVADARIPEKGARVRCSRCHHRFHITPSSSAPGAQQSAGEQGSASEPVRGEAPPRAEARAEARAEKRNEDELDNPEFLFDEKGSEDSQPQSNPKLDEAAQALREPVGPPPPEPHGLDRSVNEERVVASGGKTAQEMLDAGAPVLTSSSARFDIGGGIGSEEDATGTGTGTGTREFNPETASRPAPPAPAAASGRPARAELDALGKELGDDDESSFAGWDPLTPSSAPAEGGAPERFFDLASAIAGTPTPQAEPGPTSLFDQPELPTPEPAKKRAAPEARVFDPEAPGAAALILRVAAAIVGVGLLGASLRAMWLRSEADFAAPQVVRADGWVAADVETFLARDDLGERVLVVRGNLLPEGTAAAPQVAVRVLGRKGEVLAEAPRTWLERVDDAEIAPDALTLRLASTQAEVGAIGQQVTGFTAVLPDPPPGARRVEISLQAAPLPPRGTATAGTPPEAPPAPEAAPPTSLAEPSPAAPPADGDIVPAAPDFVD